MKLNYEDKMRIVDLKNQGWSIPEICKAVGVNDSNVKKYLRLFRQHGEEAFKRKKFNSVYSLEFKLEVIRRFKLGESKASLAVEYKIGASMIIKWLQDYEEFGYNGLITKKRGRPKMKPDKEKVINEEVYQVDSLLSSPLTDEERKELIQLRADYKKLKIEKELSEMENEFLKKLDALVRERLKREGKK